MDPGAPSDSLSSILRFQRLSVTGEPPASHQAELFETPPYEPSFVRVRGHRIQIVPQRLNAVYEWWTPVFVGRIEGGGTETRITGLLRPTWFGLIAFAAPLVIPAGIAAWGRFDAALLTFVILALVLWSPIVLDRRRAARLRAGIAIYLEASIVSADG